MDSRFGRRDIISNETRDKTYTILHVIGEKYIVIDSDTYQIESFDINYIDNCFGWFDSLSGNQVLFTYERIAREKRNKLCQNLDK